MDLDLWVASMIGRTISHYEILKKLCVVRKSSLQDADSGILVLKEAKQEYAKLK